MTFTTASGEAPGAKAGVAVLLEALRAPAVTNGASPTVPSCRSSRVTLSRAKSNWAEGLEVTRPAAKSCMAELKRGEGR